MTDIVDSATRSRMMSNIQAKNTRPEMIIRRLLFAQGFRFRLHRRDLPGVPDIALLNRKIAIFIHGCFWHYHERCRYAKLPATRSEFWKTKLEKNIARDKKVVDQLLSMGWRVMVVWECAIRNKSTAATIPEKLTSWINSNATLGEISAIGE